MTAASLGRMVFPGCVWDTPRLCLGVSGTHPTCQLCLHSIPSPATSRSQEPKDSAGWSVQRPFPDLAWSGSLPLQRGDKASLNLAPAITCPGLNLSFLVARLTPLLSVQPLRPPLLSLPSLEPSLTVSGSFTWCHREEIPLPASRGKVWKDAVCCQAWEGDLTRA